VVFILNLATYGSVSVTRYATGYGSRSQSRRYGSGSGYSTGLDTLIGAAGLLKLYLDLVLDLEHKNLDYELALPAALPLPLLSLCLPPLMVVDLLLLAQSKPLMGLDHLLHRLN